MLEVFLDGYLSTVYIYYYFEDIVLIDGILRNGCIISVWSGIGEIETLIGIENCRCFQLLFIEDTANAYF